ncbi:MAG: hypothetical protein JO192_13065 [Candidatus Eremiobacteraeota bacterium]|nr:hypothetical protein [Candidatus Eremiobacteraeota bacterium]MBV8333661.1 hypothetical protein [Candidatus Eremiobacteraeota bacterium]MBV8721500.1 hypothetical protein [Candidatus Eremiobacteraeota bacterium]
MQSRVQRCFVVCTIASLAACGGRNVVPVPSTFAGPSFVGFDVPNAGKPCQTLSHQGVWFFHGSCTSAYVKSGKTTFKLKAYKGITQTVQYPAVSGSVPAKTTFVTGEATGNGDVTGKFQGQKFPIFGSKKVPCIDQSGSPQTCNGKAVVYDLLVNGTTNTVNFTGSPSFAIRAPTILKPWRSCILQQMIQAGSGFAYQQTPVAQFVKNGRVTLPVYPSSFHMNAHTVEVFAIDCIT